MKCLKMQILCVSTFLCVITCYGNVKNGIYNSFKRNLFLDYETFCLSLQIN